MLYGYLCAPSLKLCIMGQQYDFMTDLPEPTNNDVYYKLTKF